MSGSVIAWPYFCGNSSPYDAFWDPALTLETFHPVLTACFQQTVLVWVPCGWLWAASLLYVPALHRMDTVHSTCSFTKAHLWKMILASAILIMSLVDLSETIALGVNYNTEPPSPSDYTAGAIRSASLVWAIVLSHNSYVKGNSSSGVLFIFWFLLSICVMLQVLSGGTSTKQPVTLYVYFTTVLVMLISNVFTDNSVKSPSQKSESGEKQPLLAESIDVTKRNTINNPFQAATFLSKALFFWLMPLIVKGYRKPLTFGDMWDLPEEDSASQIHEVFKSQWEKAMTKSERSGSKPSLLLALVKGFYDKMLCGAVLSVLYQLLKLVNPMLINATIFFIQSKSPYSWQGYVLALSMFLCSALGCIFINYYFFLGAYTGMVLKSAVTSAIYRKALCLSPSARRLTSTGDIVNLMSVDAYKVQESVMNIHSVWTAPFTVSVTMYLLYQKLGASCFVGLAFLVITVPLNSFVMGKMVAKYQRLQMKYKDVRIKLMNQILSGIKVLKLYAWEPYFEDKVRNIRTEELGILRKACLVQTVNFFISLSSDIVVSLLCFLTFTLSSPDHVLTPDVTFVSISLFGVLSGPLSLVPLAVMQVINGLVSLERIENFLLKPEIDTNNVEHTWTEEGGIKISNGTFSWGAAERLPLNNINLCIKEGSLVAVVGVVGSGKSSLIQAILGEMEVVTGSVNVKGSVAYVPQQAWIQNLTVRDNILFEGPHLCKQYDSIIEVCALGPDLDILPGGDMTEIGERGINLSGGQKQRVSLARAVYQDCDIYLLDDPLSAVDAHVGKHIFEHVIGPRGVLAEKTRVWVTHSLTFLSQVDTIVVLQDGAISEVGSFTELLERDGPFSEFLNQYLVNTDEYSKNGDSTGDEMETEIINGLKSESEPTEDKHIYNCRKRHTGKRHQKRPLSGEEPIPDKKKTMTALIAEEAVEEGNVKLGVISTYVRAASTLWVLLALVSLLVNVGGMVGTNIWLSAWSNDAARSVNGTETVDVGVRLGVYSALGMTQSLGVLLLSVSVTFGCIEAAKSLHNGLLTNILHCTMSFFDTTPLGRILNRFSKDVDTIDAELRVYIQTWLAIAGNILSVLIIIIYSTPIFVAVAIPMAIVFTILQKLYITSARQIKRIDSVKRSPMYSNFSETLTGVSSIRAYRQQGRFIRQADSILDDSQKMRFAVFASNRWICVWAEFIGNALMFFAAVFCVLQRDVLDGGTVGLSLSFALQLSYRIPSAVRYCSELETNIVAVERVKEYTETETEAPWVLPHRPPYDWPSRGVIEFHQYQTRYRPDLDLVLKGISATVQSSQMIGVVGRTGAGKSSLALALFRLTEAASGSVIIDGENIGNMGLHDLRSRLTIIPQDPVLFSGSLRFNVDPADQFTDAEVWTALEHAHLKGFVVNLPDTLMYEAGEDGQNLSVGQRQLVCLARALLRKSKILVMDEATAAVDLETDDLIQSTIRAQFKGCTVITIAHRLNTIMDYDRVLVLDAGLILEFDNPQRLLQDTSSMFYSMAKNAGLV